MEKFGSVKEVFSDPEKWKSVDGIGEKTIEKAKELLNSPFEERKLKDINKVV